MRAEKNSKKEEIDLKEGKNWSSPQRDKQTNSAYGCTNRQGKVLLQDFLDS